jgi:eukaryotic-like serine/threonine-protein kinase
MSVISRTILSTTAAVLICFLLAWGIRHNWGQRNKPDAGSKQVDRRAAANPGGRWPQFHGDQAQSGSVSGNLPEQLSLVWRFKAGDEVNSSPAISNGRVYIGSSDKHIYALDLQTGKQVWSAILDGMVEASPTLIDNVVYIGTLNGTLYALDAGSGSTRWTFSTGYKLVGGANWFKDSENRLRILIGSYDAFIYCIDAQTGKSMWTYKTGNYINGSPAVNGGYCAFGGCDAVIHVLSIADGAKAGEIKTDAYIAGSTAILENHVYVGNYDGELLKASLPAGDVVWSYSIDGAPIVSSPAVTNDVVVIGGGDMRVHCVDNRTGKARWTYTSLGAVDSSPVIAGDKVVVGSNDGRLYMLNLTDGRLIWSYEIGRSITSSPAIAGGMVVVGCDDGMVYCFK